MDPVSLVVTALIAGATRSLEGVAENSLKDAYAGLKGLINRFFTNRPVAQGALEELESSESQPEAYKSLLEMHVKKSGAAQDAEIQEAAQQLLALADPQGTRNGQYTITISGGIHAKQGGAAAGSMGTVNMGGYHSPSGDKPDPQ
jgi:hypothetical protein